tara:strand:- start:237 stop:392 length:156 start_codon:yes stop_codon:yes gene_type:complete
MNSKNLQKDESEKLFLDLFKRVNLCDVSKASAELMLERFCNGKEIDFPFSQ